MLIDIAQTSDGAQASTRLARQLSTLTHQPNTWTGKIREAFKMSLILKALHFSQRFMMSLPTLSANLEGVRRAHKVNVVDTKRACHTQARLHDLMQLFRNILERIHE